jgi:hypothetical protein
MTARVSDRDVRLPSSSGPFESSIYPVERSAGVSRIESADLTAERIGPHRTNVVVRGHSLLHDRVGDRLHALSREPER